MKRTRSAGQVGEGDDRVLEEEQQPHPHVEAGDRRALRQVDPHGAGPQDPGGREVPADHDGGARLVEERRADGRHPELAERQDGEAEGKDRARAQPHRERRDRVAAVALDVRHVLEDRDREAERHGDGDKRPHGGVDLVAGAERPAEVQPHADVDDDRAHERDRQRRERRKALQAQRRHRVGGSDGEPERHRHELGHALRDREDERDHRRRRDDPPPRGRAQVAGRDRQERLIDAVDLDVLELVDADDEDVHAPRGDERAGQVEELRVERAAGELDDRDRVEREHAERRADDRVRPGEPPQHDRRGAPAGQGPLPYEGAQQRLPGSAHGQDANEPCGSMRATMLAAYRATGADPPSGDPRGYHGVGMEGYFWRVTQPASGAVVVVLTAINRDARGDPWGLVALAAHPGGFVRSAVVAHVRSDRRRLGVRLEDDAGRLVLAADDGRLRVDLGADANVDIGFEDCVPWPPRWAFGGIGPAQALPGLSQYWHPHLLGARVRGAARAGAAAFDLDGATAYAEKNWGAGGHPPAWWWGQAHGFGRDDACVAFAGGRASLGPLRLPAATSVVVALGGDVLRLVAPPVPLRVEVDDHGWRLRG